MARFHLGAKKKVPKAKTACRLAKPKKAPKKAAAKPKPAKKKAKAPKQAKAPKKAPKIAKKADREICSRPSAGASARSCRSVLCMTRNCNDP